jgi:hypothetical protein
MVLAHGISWQGWALRRVFLLSRTKKKGSTNRTSGENYATWNGNWVAGVCGLWV